MDDCRQTIGLKRLTGLVSAALLVAVAPVSASTIVGIIDWDANSPGTAWFDGAGNVDVSVTSGGDQWLQIDFDGTEPADPASALVEGSAADLFAGTWNSDYWIEFDFWSDGTDPDVLQVRWGDDDSDGVWANTLSPSSGSGWQTLRTPAFGDGSEWTDVESSTADFLADLSSIDWIGVYIERPGTGDDSYGVDDFSLMVPEPAEVLMLLASFGVGCLVWRRMRVVPVVG